MPTPLANTEISNLLLPYGLSPNDALATSIRIYSELLMRWKTRVSLTSMQSPEEIVKFHFGESLFGLKVLDIENGRLADVGSGAGFPGLALKLARDKLTLYLLEPNKRKAAFLAEVVRSLRLSDVQIIRQRFQDWQTSEATIDFIVARALGDYQRLLSWSKSHLSSKGAVLLWIGGAEAFAMKSQKDWLWKTEAKIPGTQNRFILGGQPVG